MIFNRIWAMSNSETFKIKPIKELISRYLNQGVWIDPFVRNSIYKESMTFCNDLNPAIRATYNLEALEFLKLFSDGQVTGGVLFDPPYSFRQIKECYNSIGVKVHQEDTQGSYYSKKKNEIARIVAVGGVVISFGWNSGGMGKNRGFVLKEILLVPHGGSKNDTIVTVEVKEHDLNFLE